MKNLFLIFSLSFTLYIQAQPTIKWSQEFKDEKNEQPGNLLYDDGQYLYIEKDILKPGGSFSAVSDAVSKISILKFDYQMNLVKSADFVIALKEKEKLLQVKHFGSKLVIFTMKNDYDKDISQIYAEKINMETLASEGERTPIIEQQGGSLYEDKSNDSLYYVALIRMGNSLPIKIVVLNNELKPFAEREILLADSFDILRDWGARCINSNGTLFLAAKENYKEDIKNKLNKTYKDEAYYINTTSIPYIYVIPSKGEIQKYRISSSERWITEAPLRLNSDGSVIYVCVYKLNDGRKKPYQMAVDGGFILMKFDANDKQVLNLNHAFSDKLIEDLNTYHNKKNDKTLPLELSFQSVIDKGDKFYFFMINDELNFYSSGQSSSFQWKPAYGKSWPGTFSSTNSTSTVSSDRTSNESVLLSVDVSGNEIWHALLPKKQTITSAINYDNGSQAFVNSGNNFKLIYNDLEPNMLLEKPTEKDLKKFDGKKDAIVVIAEINDKGEVKKSKWNDPTLQGENIFITRSKQTGNHFFIYYYDDAKKVKKFGLTTL